MLDERRVALARQGGGAVAAAQRSSCVVLGVVGARGSAGASTLAALVAARLARRTATVLVDLDVAGGGLDVGVGIEERDGARWPDLAGARGDLDGRDVLGMLPRWGPCAVLSADRARPASPEPAVVTDVLHALAGVVGAVVLDLSRAAVLAGAAPVAACDLLVLVVPRDLRSVAGALALRPALVAHGLEPGLVVRGPAPAGLGVSELVDAIDLPLLWSGRPDRSVAPAGERGLLGVGGRAARRPAGRAARAVSAAAWRAGPWAP